MLSTGAVEHHHVVGPAARERRSGRSREDQRSRCGRPGCGEVRADRGRVEAFVNLAYLEGDVVTCRVFGDDHDAGDGIAVRVASSGEDLSLFLGGECHESYRQPCRWC